VWPPAETLIIDWGVEDGMHVFCVVLAWSRFRFVRFGADEKAATTFGLLAECFEQLGGVPKTVLADRMGCLKAGVVANVVVPTPDYVRFATHYRFRPDFCHAADPESKGMVEHLVGYAKRDLIGRNSRSMILKRRTRPLLLGARRLTTLLIPRSVRCRLSGLRWSSRCWLGCRRCG
jgi:transposase